MELQDEIMMELGWKQDGKKRPKNKHHIRSTSVAEFGTKDFSDSLLVIASCQFS